MKRYFIHEEGFYDGTIYLEVDGNKAFGYDNLDCTVPVAIAVKDIKRYTERGAYKEITKEEAEKLRMENRERINKEG